MKMRVLRPCLAWLIMCELGSSFGQELLFRSDVRLVQVYATIFDRKGHYLDGLSRDHVEIFDDGLKQPVVAFEPNSTGISCAIVLDVTGSMRDALPAVKNAVSEMLDQLRDVDFVAVYGFNTQLMLLQDFTSDKERARRAVLRTRAGGGTALFDALAGVIRDISPRNGKKAIVVFTDGADNASSLNISATLLRAQRSGIPVYSIAEGDALRTPLLMKELRTIAETTGGTFHEVKHYHDADAVFMEITRDLQHGYLISYKPPPDNSGKWHSIRLDIVGTKDFRVRAKGGYYPE